MVRSANIGPLLQTIGMLQQSNALQARRQKEAQAKKTAATSGALQAVGGVVGGIYGGPIGASIGGAAGKVIGGGSLTTQDAANVGTTFVGQQQAQATQQAAAAPTEQNVADQLSQFAAPPAPTGPTVDPQQVQATQDLIRRQQDRAGRQQIRQANPPDQALIPTPVTEQDVLFVEEEQTPLAPKTKAAPRRELTVADRIQSDKNLSPVDKKELTQLDTLRQRGEAIKPWNTKAKALNVKKQEDILRGMQTRKGKQQFTKELNAGKLDKARSIALQSENQQMQHQVDQLERRRQKSLDRGLKRQNLAIKIQEKEPEIEKGRFSASKMDVAVSRELKHKDNALLTRRERAELQLNMVKQHMTPKVGTNKSEPEEKEFRSKAIDLSAHRRLFQEVSALEEPLTESESTSTEDFEKAQQKRATQVKALLDRAEATTNTTLKEYAQEMATDHGFVRRGSEWAYTAPEGGFFDFLPFVG